MNWLAHIFLSELNIDFQLGNYLADPLKGKSWEGISKDLENGMKTHRIIDTFTDSHTSFLKSKSRIRESGLLRPIVIDITYDYFLTKNWDKYSHIPFEEFTQMFYTKAKTKVQTLPLHAKEPVEKILKFQILNKYKSVDDLERAFNRFDKRLSPRLLLRDSASSYHKELVKNIDYLEEDFHDFFPQLSNEVKNLLEDRKITHIK